MLEKEKSHKPLIAEWIDAVDNDLYEGFEGKKWKAACSSPFMLV